MIPDLLKGVHKITKRLATGKKQTYHYSWRGGPRIKAAPGSVAYAQEHLRNLDGRSKPKMAEPSAPGFKRDVNWLAERYMASNDFLKLKPPTRRDYTAHVNKIREQFDKPGARPRIEQWRDDIAIKSPRLADYRLSVLRKVLSFAVSKELMERNPAKGIDNIHKSSRADIIWGEEQLERFDIMGPPQLSRAMWFAVLTGQRQKDLLEATWSQVKNGVITFKQSKTGARVRVNIQDPRLVELLERQGKPDDHILLTSRGGPWKSGFPSAFREAVIAVGIEGRTFHDLRGTFITNRYMAGDSFRKISEASGHAEESVEEIIRKHYLANQIILRQEHQS